MRFLFGAENGLPGGAAGEDRGELRRYGALQLAHGGTLVLRHAQMLPQPVQEACGRYALARRDVGLDYPAARLVVTTDLPPPEFAQQVDAGLAACLAGAAVLVPRLHERRKDIVPLARLFLAERSPHDARSLSLAAEHVLLSQRYAHRNAAELREAIEMAAVISDEPLIQAEHIFTGPKGEGTVQEIDLTRFGLVRRLTAPKVLGALRAVVLASFAAIIAASLLRSGEREGAFANAMTWGLWEPALFVVFPVRGAGLVHGLPALDRRPPRRAHQELRRRAGGLAQELLRLVHHHRLPAHHLVGARLSHDRNGRGPPAFC